MPVIQFDYAYLSSVNAKGEQVRTRTTLDTSTGYGTACEIDVKGGGDKYAISSMQNGSRSCDQGTRGCDHQVSVR